MRSLLTLSGAALLFSLQSINATVLIHEVHYDVTGADEGEFVELFNSSVADVDISGWYLGDEETEGGGESMSSFPGGTIICGEDFLLIARDEAEFVSHFGLTPDVIMPFALSNTGDEVILSRSFYADYEDVVAYEGGSFPGVIAHPGVGTGFSLERADLIDTDDCSVDFIAINPPTPIAADCTPDPPIEGTISAFFNSSVNPSYAVYDPANGYDDLADRLILLIDQTTVSLDICVYNLSLSTVANAIITAHNRGVSVRVIIEDDNHNSYTQSMENAGITIIDDSFGGNSGSSLMHNKFVLFDYRLDEGDEDDQLWTGSYNFTYQSDTYDDNNVLVIQSSQLCAVYLDEFNEMWGATGETPSPDNSRFGGNKLDNTQHSVTIDSSVVELYFSPSDGATAELTQLIATADHDIYFCILSFTRTDVEDALHYRFNAGKPVRGVFDQAQGNDPYSVFSDMAGSGNDPWNPAADVHLDGNGSGLLHHKYILIDPQHPDSDPVVVTGSMNWSTSGGFYNDENMIVIHDPHIADQYFQEFAARFLEAGGELPDGDEEVSIHDIQYTEEPAGGSPYEGMQVTTSGMVSAVFSSGFFLSENSNLPWSGIYVFNNTINPSVGDSLTLIATVAEYYDLTELTDITDFTLHTSGLVPVPLSVSCLDAASEQYEGCFLQLSDLTVIDPDLGYGEWSVSDGSGILVVDDMGSYTYVPQLNDPIAQLTGPMFFGYGVFKLEPRDDDDILFTLPAVTDLTITTDGSTVQLSWSVIPGATYYRIYAAADPWFTPAPENLITETALLSYDEAVSGVTLFYRVVALN
jgi:phosphatidylserine/phosphatidylglycerophosphate/cardiolipin synthase-like enzyme